MKKLLLSAGALATALTPILAVVSCGDPNDGGKSQGSRNPGDNGDTSGGDTSGGDTSGGDTSGGDTSGGDTSGGDTSGGDTSGGDTSGGDTSGGDTTSPSENEIVKIDLANMNQPQDLIDELDKTLKFSMYIEDDPVDARTLLGGLAAQENLDNVATYVKNINTSKNIKLIFGEDSYTMNFDGLATASQKIIDVLDTYTLATLPMTQLEVVAIGMNILLNSTSPEMTALSANLSGTNYALDISGYLRLSSKSYGVGFAPLPSEETKNDFLQNAEYFNLLREWHKIAWDFVQSSVYNSWITDTTNGQKHFELSKEYGEGIVGYTPENVAPGERYDAIDAGTNQDIANWTNSGANPETHTVDGNEVYELSNFEAQLVQTILHLDLVTQFNIPAS